MKKVGTGADRHGSWRPAEQALEFHESHAGNTVLSAERKTIGVVASRHAKIDRQGVRRGERPRTSAEETRRQAVALIASRRTRFTQLFNVGVMADARVRRGRSGRPVQH